MNADTKTFRRGRRDPLERPLKAVFPIWIVGSLLFIVFPIYLIFHTSLAPGEALFGDRPKLFVTDYTLDWWKNAFETGGLGGPLVKSLIVASATTIVAILIAAPAAYVISRLRPSIRYTVVIGLLMTAWINGASQLAVANPAAAQPGAGEAATGVRRWPNPAAGASAHQRTDNSVVGKTGVRKSEGIVSFHVHAVIEANGITRLSDLRHRIAGEAVAIPAVSIPAGHVAREGRG